jgi:L-ribulose-5-phosphate 3-epimerase
MKFGVLQNVLGQPLPEMFTVASDLGLDGVELDWNDRVDVGIDGPLGPGRRAALRKMAANAGVAIPSIAVHWLNAGGLADPSEETQRAGFQGVLDGIALCRDLGATALLVPFFGRAEISNRAARQRLIGHLSHLAPEAEAAGVTLAIEHSLAAEEALTIFQAVNSPWVADYWDMGNALCFGYDPLHEIRVLGHHIARVHAKEYDAAVEKRHRYDGLNGVPFGQGAVPVPAVLRALQEIGYEGYLVLETGTFGDAVTAARSALGVLLAALGEGAHCALTS